MLSRNIVRIASKTTLRGLPLMRNEVLWQVKFYSSDLENKKQDLISKLESSDSLRLAFEEFGKLMENKGFHPGMGIMQQMKFLMDGEVKAGLKKVGLELRASGIEVKPEDIKTFAEILSEKK